MPDAHGSTILIVDDSPENLAVLDELLRPAYRVRAATSGTMALRVMESAPRPDLVLLDVLLPDMDGYEIFSRLRADPASREVPVMFVTASTGPEAEMRGLSLGAVDYIAKPIVPSVLLARVRNQLELKQARDRLKDQNARLEGEVGRRMAESDLIQTVSIRALAHLAETRDPETGQHILRTQAYVRQLARLLRGHPRFAGTLSERYIELLAQSAPLHDIGKVGIPDAILRKSGPLTAEEWAVMKTHPRLGAEAIEQVERDIGRPVDFLSLAKEIARWHHERWDGGGYPDGLAGEAIPVSARLMTMADVFDALVSPRAYKAPLTYREAMKIIGGERGGHLDPDVADAFLGQFDLFKTIADSHRDVVSPLPGRARVAAT